MHGSILTPPHFVEVSVSRPGSVAVMYLCVRGIDIGSFCNFVIRFRKFPDDVVFSIFHFIGKG